MIFVLTISYLLLVWWIYFRRKLLPFDLTNKIGVSLVGVVLIFGLLMATNYCHPHSADVRVIRYVIPIATNLPKPAQVVEVPIRPNVPVKKGEVLFVLDSRPFEYEVRRLEAALAAANTDSPKLQAEVKSAEAALAAADAKLQEARIELERNTKLVATNAVTQEIFERSQTVVRDSEAGKREAAAQLERAQLALESKIEGEFTSVAQVRQQLAAARLDLDQTTVRAPEDGFVTDLAIRPGIMAAPSAPVLSFVSTSQPAIVVATYSQNSLRNIKPGAKAEIVFAMYPGRVFKAAVETVIEITGQGQVAVGGDLPEVTTPEKRGRFVVRLKLADVDLAELPAGAGGSVIVYTDTIRPLGIIQKMAIRMEGYANFITGFN